VPTPIDKRSRNDLDLFVLALIDSGVSAPDDLQKVASLSTSGTIPALKRLLHGGYVVQDERGPRYRTALTITSEGWYYLKNGWRDLVEYGPSGDIDTDLRVALVALWAGADRRLVATFMNRSGEKRLAAIGRVEEEVEPAEIPPLAFWYKRLRATSKEAILKGESAATLAVVTNLPKAQFAKLGPSRKLPRS